MPCFRWQAQLLLDFGCKGAAAASQRSELITTPLRSIFIFVCSANDLSFGYHDGRVVVTREGFRSFYFENVGFL